jgi:uncharacterized protein
LLLVSAAIYAQNFPSPRGFVNDFADVISAQDEAAISRTAQAVEQATSIEIAVVTVESMAPYGSIEEFSIDLATAWGVGKEGEDNGILVVLAIAERKTRIEVGYSLEGVFTDGLTGRIMDTSMVPYFRNDDFSTGLTRAVEGIAGVIAEEYDVDLAGVSVAESQKYESSGSSISLYSIMMVLVVVFIGGGRFLWPLLMLGGLSRRSRYSRGGFGVSSRGGFGSRGGGGFSGFGGGGFGGGGASRGF